MTHSSKAAKKCETTVGEKTMQRGRRGLWPRGGRWSKCAVSFMQTGGNDANDSHYMHIVGSPGGVGCGGSMHRCTDVQ